MSRRREKQLAGVNVLDLVPYRIAESEQTGDRVTVIRPRPEGEGLRTPVEWLIYLLAAHRVKLDAIGSYVWHEIDGTRTVRELAACIRAHFGENVEPMDDAPGTSVEERLGEVIRVLRRERLVGYAGWDDARR